MGAIAALVKQRLFIVFVVAMLVFLALLGRLGYVQLIQGKWLSGKAEELWARNIPFEAKRGEILDRNGNKLAYNVSAPSVMVIPAQIKEPAKAAKRLAAILHASETKIYREMTKKQLIVRLNPEGRKISEATARQIQAMKTPGIVITEDSKRYHPDKLLAAHLLGFTGIDNQGLAGLELIYDQQLRGQRGAISFSSNARGERLPGGVEHYIPPRDGAHLQLTIDRTVQMILERELDQAMAAHHPENVLAIAMKPQTGEILGMASRPAFNPDQYRHVKPEIYNRNLPIWKTYEPGSTFKIITLSAALEEKKVSFKEGFFDPGFATVGGAHLRCWKKGGHGSQTFLQVVENSCNPGFVALGQRLGKQKLFSYIYRFGFGEKTSIDLNGEAKGILFRPDRVGPVELATTAFGQGVSVTPIQQVAAVSAAVNGGKLYRPFVAKAWLDPKDNHIISQKKPIFVRRVISEETSRQVRIALESVVAQGTGRKAFVDGYRVGGKTGTAQKVGPDGRYMTDNHIVSFIGIAPADHPEVVVYVAVDNPQGIQFGGVVAAPIVGNMIDDILRYLGVPKRTHQIEPKKDPLEPELVKVPNLIGQTPDEIQNSLSLFGLEVKGQGKKVINQVPKGGQRLKKGSTIRIYLG
ncbi:stage V sporulation protein D (sporulation-specific penicillin-binding protein) [Seinonella peptonophila]|uniref:Stage V sporulation protein D (Sporulation-specific penicillin-binding protein) n=1 Tax=Seinonella peptonophila TaxID=112248 RepID=A0A1M4V013_9BACL|nr:stage V sporulation protein D [Seinonella peptonophila]SHE62233.1 stage V sporulation protein D (sporulation-specific penicillin-binding protein) [Seinonella peptonophila]